MLFRKTNRISNSHCSLIDKWLQVMEGESYAESRVMYYHLYVADKEDILKHHIHSLRVDEMDFNETGHLVSGEKAVEYIFDRQANITSSVVYDDAFLPKEKQDQGVFYARDDYLYNLRGDPVEHRQFSNGEFFTDLFEDLHYVYDERGLVLSTELINYADPSNCFTEFYQYDDQGNLIEELSDNGFRVQFEYDQQGLLLRQVIHMDKRRVISHFTYNEKGQLIEFKKEGEVLADMEEVWFRRTFDDEGRVIEYESLRKNNEKQMTRFYYQGDHLCRRETFDEHRTLLVVEDIEYNENGLISALYTRSPDGVKIEEEQVHYTFFDVA